MMVDLTICIHSTGVHPGGQQHLDEGDHEGEYQPDINHLHVGGGGERARHTDEESCQDKKGCEVDSNNSFKEKIFEKVGSIDNAEEKESREIDCEDSIRNPSLECQ